MSTAEQTPARPSETVAGFLASMAIFVGLIGIAWHPLRLIAPAIILSMIASGMGGRHQKLAFASVVIVGFCFILGMTIAVITRRSLW